ncbi:hypothetical protein VKT23_012546 [Stygiomarasmius scandens]|uniref:SIS domain-containing protein n=1 Tax=Marasmiellus scandens TaxID=2682957 RepID=A0ABR1J9H4_9AGAR
MNDRYTSLSPTPILSPNLASLASETPNPRTVNIDTCSTLDICKVINEQDTKVALAVSDVVPKVAEVIDAIAERIMDGGRLLYMGAGTSGRIGLLDASSLPTTFSADPNQFIALIAGGDQSLRRLHPNEGVEDSREAGVADLEALLPYPQDTLIGITASGRTPYVLGALARAKRLGLLTIGLVTTRPSAVLCEGSCEFVIDPAVGPEVIAGSTRMKAGTATKMILNMISTGIHIKLGHTYGNLMIDIQASNTKLVQRARRIIRSISSEFTLPPTYAGIMTDDEQLDVVVRRCNGSVKLALVVIVSGWGVDLCRDALERRKGFLKAVLEDVRYETVVRVFKN